uniref:Putative secreted protein n=1 Tax=Anopheles triannulatus TaxID=58253 RepID=A0A2M4B4X3_9DIPT
MWKFIIFRRWVGLLLLPFRFHHAGVSHSTMSNCLTTKAPGEIGAVRGLRSSIRLRPDIKRISLLSCLPPTDQTIGTYREARVLEELLSS